jgi:hypothetical protein
MIENWNINANQINTWLVSPSIITIEMPDGNKENINICYFSNTISDSISHPGSPEVSIIIEDLERLSLFRYLYNLAIDIGKLSKICLIHNSTKFENGFIIEIKQCAGWETFFDDCDSPMVLLSEEIIHNNSKQKQFIMARFLFDSSQ